MRVQNMGKGVPDASRASASSAPSAVELFEPPSTEHAENAEAGNYLLELVSWAISYAA